MFDVITFGSATYDVFLRSSGMQITEGDICVRYGAKLEVNEIYFDYGGGGTNSAVTFARQGLNTAGVVQVGDDFNGKKILADLQREGVNTGLVDVQSGFTDYSTILWAPDGGRTILIYRGNTRLEVENIKWDKLDTKWFYIASLEGNLDIVEKLIKLSAPLRSDAVRTTEGQTIKIVWNPGGRELKQREKILSLLPGITVLNLNKEEMIELLGGGEKWEVGREVGNVGINELLKEAQELPCEYVVITDDKRGACLWDRNNAVWWKNGIFEDSPRVETTGAGDAFGSGLVTGFIQNKPIEECLYLAAANASSVVGRVGAKSGILKLGDLKNWDKSLLKREKLI